VKPSGTKPSPRVPRVAAIEPAARPRHPERAAVGEALTRCTPPQRVMLALKLVERLSSVEAAATLGITVRQFDGSYRALIADLRRALGRHGARRRSAACGEVFEIAPMRRVS